MDDGIKSVIGDLRISSRLQDDLALLAQRGKLTLHAVESANPITGESSRFLVLDPLAHGATRRPKAAFPEKRSVTAIVSSRLGRQLDQKDEFFRVLRVACSQLDPQRQSLLSAPGSAVHPFVCRAAELLGVPMRTLQIADLECSLEAWVEECLQHLEDGDGGRLEELAKTELFVSPPLDAPSPIPLRDAIPILWASQVLVVHLRPNGNMDALVRQRLANNGAGRVFLAMGNKQLVSSEIADPLLQLGAIGWVPLDSTSSSPLNTLNAARVAAKVANQQVLSLDQLTKTDQYLTHCTRGRKGAWPGQDEDDFLDELILGAPTRDRSALAALIRILTQQSILASSEAIRGGASVVSFTAADLKELPTLRCFRAHRGRWDFEPYGVCIERSCLESLGARQVVYGKEGMWDALTESEKPYFQKIGEDESSIDWSVEQEFRLMNDVDLAKIPPEKMLVFVPTEEEARHVATLSRWPVFVLPKDRTRPGVNRPS